MIRLAAIFLLSAALAFGQQTVNYASVSGRVTDASGAVVVARDVFCSRIFGWVLTMWPFTERDSKT
jgi:hypothetical protein